MKIFKGAVVSVVALSAIAPVLAQNQRAGISTPPPTILSDPPAQAKPSAAIPYTAPTERVVIDISAPATASPDVSTDSYKPFTETGGNSYISNVAITNDVDSGIVTHVVSGPNEIPDGTVVKVRLRQQLSTADTRVGSEFQAEVTEAVLKEGRVIIPAGALLDGRVTMVRGGGRVAAIHLEPRMVTLANGTHYYLRARVIDTDRTTELRVDDEGTILRRAWDKKTLAALALTTGGAATAGAMMAGVPGALIGAGVGIGASSVVMLKQKHQEVLPMNTAVVFCLTVPMQTTPTRDSASSNPAPISRLSGE